jgi:uncharacterized membrane protein
MFFFIFWIFGAFIVAHYGSLRTIGGFKTLLISLLFSPVIGLIVVALSTKLDVAKKEAFIREMKFREAQETFMKHHEILKSRLEKGELSEEDYEYEVKRLNEYRK